MRLELYKITLLNHNYVLETSRNYDFKTHNYVLRTKRNYDYK